MGYVAGAQEGARDYSERSQKKKLENLGFPKKLKFLKEFKVHTLCK